MINSSKSCSQKKMREVERGFSVGSISFSEASQQSLSYQTHENWSFKLCAKAAFVFLSSHKTSQAYAYNLLFINQ